MQIPLICWVKLTGTITQCTGSRLTSFEDFSQARTNGIWPTATNCKISLYYSQLYFRINFELILCKLRLITIHLLTDLNQQILNFVHLIQQY